jgi:hypothetical protein
MGRPGCLWRRPSYLYRGPSLTPSSCILPHVLPHFPPFYPPTLTSASTPYTAWPKGLQNSAEGWMKEVDGGVPYIYAD